MRHAKPDPDSIVGESIEFVGRHDEF